MRSERQLIALSAAVLLGTGCMVFDDKLYKRLDPSGLPQDASMDGSVAPGSDGSSEDDAGHGDHDAGGDGDGDGDVQDAGPPRLADQCTSRDMFTLRSNVLDERNQVAFIASTADFTNDISETACFEHNLPGAEGMMAIQMVTSERWHFHIKPMNDTSKGQPVQDPVVYVRRDCTDNRGCNEGSYLNLCGDGHEEHFTFEAPNTGTYYFILDDRNNARGDYLITAVKPQCNNGVQEHNESCDTPGPTCSLDCRHLLNVNNTNELEPNDDWTMANIMAQVAVNGSQSIKGSLGGVCDRDMFAFQVPAKGNVAVRLRRANADPCPDDLGDATPIKLELLGADSKTVLGEGIVRSGSCPSIEASDAFANGLDEGLYYVRLFGDEKKRSFPYELTVTVSN